MTSETPVFAPLELLRRNAVCAHIRAQSLWDYYTSVRLLIVFYNRHPSPADGQATAVEGMQQLRFVFAIGAKADVCPSRLE